MGSRVAIRARVPQSSHMRAQERPPSELSQLNSLRWHRELEIQTPVPQLAALGLQELFQSECQGAGIELLYSFL